MKERVYIITRHAITNYGSLLQTYATQNIIEDLGYFTKIIDYVREDEEYKTITNILLEKNTKWNKNFFTRIIYKIIQGPEYYIMGRRFEKMRSIYLRTTKKVSCLSKTSDIASEADIYITGSDQVWGPIGGEKFDPAYFLDFVCENKKKVAYAASFGRTEFNDELWNDYLPYLKSYDSITVREESAVQILNEKGFDNIVQVLDPTLLLTADWWNEIIPKKKIKEYVLIYQLHNNRDMDIYAKKFAKKANLPLIRVTPTLHQTFRGGKTKLLPNMGYFLYLIKNAKYMITDSFHGTAFAINFGVQFVNVLSSSSMRKSSQSNIEKTKTRNLSLLGLTGLENRILNDYDDFHYINDMIDYEPVNKIINECRLKSLNELKRILEVKK